MRCDWLGIVLAAAMASGCYSGTEVDGGDGGTTPGRDGGGGTGGAAGNGGAAGSTGGKGGGSGEPGGGAGGTAGGEGGRSGASGQGGSAGDGGEDVCSLPMAVGPCDALMPRYFFDAGTGQCEPFNYGGCQGNANNFETVEQCEQVCGGGASDGCRDALPIRCGDRLTHSTIVQGRGDTWSGYSCSQRFESGRETIYVYRSDDSCMTMLRLDGIAADLDLFLLDGCSPWSCTAASPTPLDIQTIEMAAFHAEAGGSYYAVVDGYDYASGAYSIEADCLCGDTADGYADGEWVMQVDRRWDRAAGSVQFPFDEIDEEYYQPVDDGAAYAVAVSGGWGLVAVGDTPLGGELTGSSTGKLTYDLTDGTFAGGRFVVWAGDSGLQAELTIYGSGLPIISSERGALDPKQ